jgi:hypothetical protein
MNPDADDRIRARAEQLLPEETSAGSDDPQAQARAILAESDQREHGPDIAPDTVLEHRTSDETVVAAEPPD